MYCQKCGAECSPTDKFCNKCGANLNPTIEDNTQVQNTPCDKTNNYRPRPNNYLAWAIITTIICCLPTGIVSIIYASKVDNLYTSGNYAEAEEASRKARTWAIASAIISLSITTLYIIVYIALIAGTALSINDLV